MRQGGCSGSPRCLFIVPASNQTRRLGKRPTSGEASMDRSVTKPEDIQRWERLQQAGDKGIKKPKRWQTVSAAPAPGSHKNSLNKAGVRASCPRPRPERLAPRPPRASAGPPLPRARHLFPQRLPPAAAPEAPPRALRYARGPRRPSAQTASEQREAAGPRRHALPSASGGPAVSSAVRPGPSAGFRGAGRG